MNHLLISNCQVSQSYAKSLEVRTKLWRTPLVRGFKTELVRNFRTDLVICLAIIEKVYIIKFFIKCKNSLNVKYSRYLQRAEKRNGKRNLSWDIYLTLLLRCKLQCVVDLEIKYVAMEGDKTYDLYPSKKCISPIKKKKNF